MIISKKYKFIYYAHPKTGTTSIEEVFGDLNDVRKPGRLRNKHIWPDLFAEYTPIAQECSDYFTFGFVRNPWDYVCSWYCFRQRITDKNHKNYVGETSFRDFVIKYTTSPVTTMCSFFAVGTENCVDYIGRYETLQQDLNTVCDKIGIRKRKLPKLNKSVHKTKHYTEYYDDESREIVAERYAQDIELFGYKFGE
jgi:hypothetical protein